jgi:tRNA1Val (adenine37-N6)-methyltransferase
LDGFWKREQGVTFVSDPRKETTVDSLFRGRLKIIQKRKGYRFSIDSALLAKHVSLKTTDVAVDLGTGCGIIPLILSFQTPSAHIYAIEIQEQLAELASENIQINGMEETISVIHGDMKDFRTFLTPGSVDVVFSNPPYRRLHSGRVNPETERAVARHEIKASLTDILSAAEGLLKASGRFVVIFPAERTADLISQMRAFKLEAKRLRWIHSREDSEAKLVVAEGTKHGNPGLKVDAPLFIYEANGEYTEEVKEMLGNQG